MRHSHLSCLTSDTSSPSGSSPALITPYEVEPRPSLTTEGALLGKKIAYWQFVNGYRSGIEPVFLAAMVPARRGEHIFEAGCGAGAGLLCLFNRVPGICGVGLETDLETVALARFNLHQNNVSQIAILHGQMPHIPSNVRRYAQKPNGRFHHAFANPPWHPHHACQPANSKRQLALFAPPSGWECWIEGCAKWILPGGTLSLALPAAGIDATCQAFQRAGFGSIKIFPLWPKAGKRAKIVFMRATLGGRGETRLEAGLILHEEGGRYTPCAEAILIKGAALPL